MSSDSLASSLISMKDSLLDLAWPKRCVGCERLGVLFCDDCRQLAATIQPEQACPRCGAPHGALICSECYTTNGPLQLGFSAAISVYQFEGAAARLVSIYKDQHEQRLAAICASLLADAVPLGWLRWADCLSYVPAGYEKVRARGFDHMQLFAMELSNICSLPVRELLSKQGGEDQRSLNREQRLQNLSRALVCCNPDAAKAQNILLIDDVMTTTATMQAAANALLTAGAREVRVATICRVY